MPIPVYHERPERAVRFEGRVTAHAPSAAVRGTSRERLSWVEMRHSGFARNVMPGLESSHSRPEALRAAHARLFSFARSGISQRLLCLARCRSLMIDARRVVLTWVSSHVVISAGNEVSR